MVVVISEDGEDAIFQVNMTKALIQANPPRRTRFRRRSNPVERRLLLELGIGRVVAAGEAYLVMRATRQLKPELLQEIPPPDPPDAMTSLLRNAVKHLNVLEDVWKDELGVDLSTLPEWNVFRLLRKLRHVLVHRLGYWQPGLDPKDDLASRITAAGLNPDLYRGPIPLDEAEFDRSCALTLDLVDVLEAS